MVFLCHASGDKATVRNLYQRLLGDGFKPWFDEEDLLPGQDWSREIPKTVRAAHVVLVCLSQIAVNKEGYVQKEISFALDMAIEKPEGTIFIIPLKLEECNVPQRLSQWHWVDNSSRGYERLVRALRMRAESLGLGSAIVETSSKSIEESGFRSDDKTTGGTAEQPAAPKSVASDDDDDDIGFLTDSDFKYGHSGE
jgi:TIR domain